jgi:hypothetical protein
MAIICVSLALTIWPATLKRIARVGNVDYRAVGILTKPANEAKLLARALRLVGFTLIGEGARLDVDKRGAGVPGS